MCFIGVSLNFLSKLIVQARAFFLGLSTNKNYLSLCNFNFPSRGWWYVQKVLSI
jgi:hypothetical protein